MEIIDGNIFGTCLPQKSKKMPKRIGNDLNFKNCKDYPILSDQSGNQMTQSPWNSPPKLLKNIAKTTISICLNSQKEGDV